MTDALTIGDVAQLDYTVTVAGALTDATVTVTVTAPDGTETAAAVTHVSTGTYRALVLVDQSGTWQYQWEASGSAVDTEDGTFDVRAIGETTDLFRIRLLINDVDPDDQVFSDTDLQVFLALEGDSVKLAAAQALDVIASNESLVKQRIKTLDLQTDGPAVANDLREHATRLRASVDDDASGTFEFTTGMGTPELVEHETCWPY